MYNLTMAKSGLPGSATDPAPSLRATWLKVYISRW